VLSSWSHGFVVWDSALRRQKVGKFGEGVNKSDSLDVKKTDII